MKKESALLMGVFIFSNLFAQTETQSANNEKRWSKTISFGITAGNMIEFNNPNGEDKKNLSLNATIDLMFNYISKTEKFRITNEMHYLFGIQREGLTGGNHLQRVQDDLNTLHDASISVGKNNKWNINLIVKTATPLVKIYDGEYFADHNNGGPIKAFASPYDATISPGIKFQPNQHLRISFSPYSFQLYGVKNNTITTKGIFITETDITGAYKSFLFKRLGAEVNFWYDKQVGEWLNMQYRVGLSSDYFEKIGKTGLLDCLFITKIKIVKDIYLSHRATLKSNLAENFLKPYYNQLLLLTYAKMF